MRIHILIILAAASAAAQPHGGDGQPAAGKTAEQVYKNITELKGTPADQVMPAMQFISASLGVECSFCHVQDKFEADDKLAKRTARSMIAMTRAINQNSFRGQQQVTCYSCHRGSGHPSNTPPVADSETPAHPAAAPPAGAPALTADQIIDKYIAAVGGADRIRKISSRNQKGVLLAMGSEMAIEVITKAPDKRISISKNTAPGSGESFTAFDGTNGWQGNTGHPPREMTPPEAAAASIDAEFYFPLRLKEIYPQLRRTSPEEIGGVACDTLSGSAAGKPSVRLFFDQQTGLLLRMIRYADTPVGRIPTQIDYADYRAADDIKIPFRWTLSRPNARFTIQISEVESNVPVDDARFAKPHGEVK